MDQSPAGTTGGIDSFDGGELYVVVRKAVEDAIFNVIATLVQLLIAFVLVWFAIVVGAAGGFANPIQLAAGIFVGLVGIYFAATALGVVSPIGDWLR